MPELAQWDSFYVIVGSAAGALIGLQFVVMTLIAERPAPRAAEGGAAFATPTIVHLGTALLLSAVLRAPWQAIGLVAALWGFTGLGGVAYAAIVARRMRAQTIYQPEFEDWLFILYCRWPRTRYSRSLPSQRSRTRARPCLALEGRRCCYFLSEFNNVWDSVTYHVFR